VNSAVIVFPGSNCDRDMAEALRQVTGRAPAMVWHRESALPDGIDLIAIPGGFSYGDYLRSGAMAAQSPIMRAVGEAAGRGVAVLGVCNGFQVLTEARLLPGALMRNAGIRFVCRDVPLKVENSQSLFTARYEAGEEIVIPVAHPGRLPLCRRPQRLGAGHRRHPQRGRQRAGHDAPPRARGRSRPRPHRRAAAVRGPAGVGGAAGLTPSDRFGEMVALLRRRQAGGDVDRRLGLADPRNIVALAFDGEDGDILDRRRIDAAAAVNHLALGQ
jgi:hypothetical protein